MCIHKPTCIILPWQHLGIFIESMLKILYLRMLEWGTLTYAGSSIRGYTKWSSSHIERWRIGEIRQRQQMQHKIISPHLTPEVRGWIVVPLRAAADPRYSTNVSLIPRTAAASLACYSSQSCKSLQAASASVWCVCVWTEAPAVSSFQLIYKSLG